MRDVMRLGSEAEPAIVALLTRDPVVNLFPIGFLAVHPVDRAWWYGVGDGALVGVVLVLPGRLAVPFSPDPVAADALGAHLAQQHRPCMAVGPRVAVDRVWATWTGDAPVRHRHDQQLYVVDRADAPAVADPPGFRKGTAEDASEVSRNAAQMELEDLGTDPAKRDHRLHDNVVLDRLRAGRTFVLEHQGEIVFQVNVGTEHRLGCQIGGTFVPPRWRGNGFARVGVAATVRALLEQYPRVTLHVREGNGAAIRAYERAGFRAVAPFRLMVP